MCLQGLATTEIHFWNLHKAMFNMWKRSHKLYLIILGIIKVYSP
jgi:hypothetical protein